MRSIKFVLPVLLSLLAWLSPLPVAAAQNDEIAAVFHAKFGAYPDEINATKIPGIYQVVSGHRIVYMDSGADFMIQGDVVSTKTGNSLSEKKLAEISLKTLKELDRRDAVETKVGKGERILYTFEDPNCGYCKKLASELKQLANVTIYTFPVAFLGPDSEKKVRDLLCSQNRPGVWDAYMFDRDANAPRVSCEATGLERNMGFAQKLAISGTPTLFFQDGSRIVGYTAASNIESRLSASPRKH